MGKGNVPLLDEAALRAFREGTDTALGGKLGAHLVPGGVRFAVWAPAAARVDVVGDFNGWKEGATRLERIGSTGVWQGFAPGVGKGALYKYRLTPSAGGAPIDKADPLALLYEAPPGTASVVWSLTPSWTDAEWMQTRAQRQAKEAPMSIYEVHLGSWRRFQGDPARLLSYREIAPLLADHVERIGFTHVELMPVMEHPFYGSWGYHVTGYFAPTRRYGTPEDLMALVDHLHQRGIGVVFDWVPAHFAVDPHALGAFDGQAAYESADPRRARHPDWDSYLFDFARPEVRSFLLASAALWLDTYHGDALRVDGVASMVAFDHGRPAGEWLPNERGGRENDAGVAFVKAMNDHVHAGRPSVYTMAEESSAWPGITKPTTAGPEGGLGFDFKWDMGWMHDTLKYLALDPIHRARHHDTLTFRSVYADSESFILPLSHDEVVRGQGSLLARMPGDDWQKLANLRLLYAYQFALPGKKLLFMGDELATPDEWDHDAGLDWSLAEKPGPAGVLRMLTELHRLYRSEPGLHARDAVPGGFEWIDGSNAGESILLFARRGEREEDYVVVGLNFTPVPRPQYRVGVPWGGRWREIFNSDAREYGGSGRGNLGGVEAAPVGWHGRRSSIVVELPPLGAVFFKR